MTSEKRNFKRTVVAHAALIAVCGTAAMVAPQEVFAQQTLQRVEVTGTNVRRSDTETPSPVQVITRQELDQSGKATVGDYLQTLTSDGQGSVPTTYGRGFSGATASGISLRGLGANATLVLVNGRRVAPAVLADDAQRAFVDLNSLPLEAVERIDVVKDGASAIYGSDAVAGVVNIILMKSYVGTTVKASYGVSGKGDGNEPRIAITHGRGDMDKDGWNLLLNLEAGKKDPMYYRDRGGNIGRSVLTPDGIPASTTGSNNIARAGGNGVIPTNSAGVPLINSSSQSIIGNVAIQPPTGNPTTQYYSRGNPAIPGAVRPQPGAQAYCNANANLVQNDPGGGCITDMWKQLGQIHPESDSVNLYGRFTKRLGADTEAWVEAGYYKTSSRVENNARVPNGGYLNPNGSVSSNLARFRMSGSHPDNPFAQEARLSYNPGLEIGPGITDSESDSIRFQTGLKSTLGSWDIDTAFSFSQAKQTDTTVNAINWRVANALMNPTAANVAAATANSAAYAALPAGTLWRIGENAGLNSAAMYDALLDNKSRDGKTKYMSLDFKANTEIGKLEGGPVGLAVGGEIRREESNLGLYEGLGDYIGLSYTTYGGKRTVAAAFAELNLPITKRIEANAAARVDHYSDAGNAFTPKIGAKWRVVDNVALRSTYAHSFRAPSFTENGINSLAAFGGPTINDRVRVAAGVPTAAAFAPAFLQRGNPDLEPEKSKSFTLGTVWDILPTTSMTLDYFQIKRKGLPVIESPQDAVDAGRVTRDPSGAQTPTDPGPILQGFVQFENANQSTTRGFDVEAKHRMNLDAMGRLTFGANWTHLLEQSVTQADGTTYEYAGSHGDCHITNCIGTPRNRIRLWSSWEWNAWTLGAIINYRGSMSARDPQDHPDGCAWTRPDGTSMPDGCKIKSFTTVDVSGQYRLAKNTEIFGSIQNLFDTKPPFDPVTYGAIGYNPLDYSGAIGRYFRIGLKHKF